MIETYIDTRQQATQSPMSRYFYVAPAQTRWNGALHPVLQLPIYFEAPRRMVLESLPPALQTLLKDHCNSSSIEVVTTNGAADGEYDR